MAYANKLSCNATHTDCDVIDSLPVKLIVNYTKVTTYYGVTINGVLGVKTAYCINDDGAAKCPDWVSPALDRKSTRLNSSHANISYAVFCLKKKNNHNRYA